MGTVSVSKSNVFKPNKSVKGTRRPQALMKVGGSFEFAGFAKVLQPARP
jgi:hypothetical protein